MRRNAPLQDVKVYGPFEQVHIDILGPVNESAAGNNYVSTIIGQSARWVELISLPRQEVNAQAVFQEWICHYACPVIIVSDRRKNCLSKLIEVMCKRFHIQRIKTSAFNPKSNGVVE